jgi:hypothetical protein
MHSNFSPRNVLLKRSKDRRYSRYDDQYSRPRRYHGVLLSLPRPLDDFAYLERYGRGIKQADKSITHSESLLIEPRFYCDTHRIEVDRKDLNGVLHNDTNALIAAANIAFIYIIILIKL